MSSPSPIILILGSGANIGHHVARAFAAKGYKVALTSRKQKEANGEDSKNQIHIASDLSDPESVAGVFSKVKSQLGHPPSVVVYNGKSPLSSIKTQALNASSRRRHAKRPEEPLLPLAHRFHPRHKHQHHKRLRRRATSRARLRGAPRLGLQNLHLHGQRAEHPDHRCAAGPGRRQIGYRAHDPVGCWRVC